MSRNFSIGFWNKTMEDCRSARTKEFAALTEDETTRTEAL
jgi:hypothetical protein